MIKTQDFIQKYRTAFGPNAALPMVFFYTDTPLAETENTKGCFLTMFDDVSAGKIISINASNIGCNGGKFYTGFAEMSPSMPAMVAEKERYKQSPQQVVDAVRDIDIRKASASWLNVMRVDKLDDLSMTEGMIFLATPDVLAGLCGWAFYDYPELDAVVAYFGSGCSTMFANVSTEHRRGGQRCFMGLMDPSTRTRLSPDIIGFAIPGSRLESMYQTMDKCFLTHSRAWEQIRSRI